MQGVKDIVLASTQKPMSIRHVQFGPYADIGEQNTRDAAAIHMFCAPKTDVLTHDLEVIELKPSSSATLLTHRMQGSDWRWILTNHI